MHKLHPTSLSHSKFYDNTPILGLETLSFAAVWCFGGYGGYSTTTASSVEATSSRLAHSIAFLFPYPLPEHIPSQHDMEDFHAMTASTSDDGRVHPQLKYSCPIMRPPSAEVFLSHYGASTLDDGSVHPQLERSCPVMTLKPRE
ncbi:hypothetical protein M405DRAFT_844994 [Rhizopogon salebrosus TDB-379]|nr:hypothetical protein M405DRAFT_844994 [Rhizopogon salebrosus TDB-379]